MYVLEYQYDELQSSKSFAHTPLVLTYTYILLHTHIYKHFYTHIPTHTTTTHIQVYILEYQYDELRSCRSLIHTPLLLSHLYILLLHTHIYIRIYTHTHTTTTTHVNTCIYSNTNMTCCGVASRSLAVLYYTTHVHTTTHTRIQTCIHEYLYDVLQSCKSLTRTPLLGAAGLCNTWHLE